ncbi:DUF551 domain-containing protein [Rahnella inusitata]|uniref:DUF551 domain-containing protein n=1 Tax=Rahnella inusitata TaxID=58169 RepID=UPI0039AF2AD0
MNTFTKDPSTHPANGPLTEERLIRVRDELAAAAKRSDGGNLGYIMADAAKAIDEVLARRATPQLPQPAVPECYQRLLHHAYGMTMGHDWNKGTMAGHHREKLCKAVEECRAAMLQGAEPVQEWIPCSELTPPRIPDTSIEYLVYETMNNRVSHDYWNVPEGNRSFQAFWNHYSDSVTHWMPLPAAPQQEVRNGR